MKFLAGLILGLLLAAAIPLALVATGRINMAATQTPGGLEKAVGKMAWEKSMSRQASDAKNPFTNDADALRVGLAHYQENCFVCHAAPGMKFGEIAQGMNPAPPMLDHVSDMTDGELFWLIKHGIRMTGMPAFGPTHTDAEIWKMELFVRHLTQLTEEEKTMLSSSGVEADEHHHDEEEKTAEQPQEEHHHKDHHH